jgi:AraC family transcriptional regulator of adaptative response / DNA-3-methyladenine glycosylase II
LIDRGAENRAGGIADSGGNEQSHRHPQGLRMAKQHDRDCIITSETARRVRKMFDLDCDPALIAKSFEKIPLLATLCRCFPGLRLAQGWDPFEIAICSILGHLVSAEHRENLIRQLVSNYGEQIVDPSTAEKTTCFPAQKSWRPQTLARSGQRWPTSRRFEISAGAC